MEKIYGILTMVKKINVANYSVEVVNGCIMYAFKVLPRCIQPFKLCI